MQISSLCQLTALPSTGKWASATRGQHKPYTNSRVEHVVHKHDTHCTNATLYCRRSLPEKKTCINHPHNTETTAVFLDQLTTGTRSCSDMSKYNHTDDTLPRPYLAIPPSRLTIHADQNILTRYNSRRTCRIPRYINFVIRVHPQAPSPVPSGCDFFCFLLFVICDRQCPVIWGANPPVSSLVHPSSRAGRRTNTG